MDERGSDGCVGAASSLGLGEDDTLADPDTLADTDADTDADPGSDVVVSEGRLDGSGDGMLGDELAGALGLGEGTGTDGAGTAGWVVEGDGEAEWSGAGDEVAVDARLGAGLVREAVALGVAGLAAGVLGSRRPEGAVLAGGVPTPPVGSDAGAGRPGAFSDGREPDRLADRVGGDASRPTPPSGRAWPAGFAGTAERMPPTSTVMPVASTASVLTAISAIAAPGRAFV